MGLSYSEWCKKWCYWVASIPKKRNPTFDNSGFLTSAAQNVPEVIFLCQTFESVSTVPHRTINMPNNSNIFMPIINWISVKEANNTEYLIKLANAMIDEVVELRFMINGKNVPIDLTDFRFQSSVFNLVLPEGNIFDVEPGETSIVTDGFWIFFRPFVKDFTIETYGACRSGMTHIEVSYQIIS